MHRGLSLGASIHHQQQQNRGGSNNVYDGKIAGLYDLEETLGRGHFAVVKLARHVFTGEKVAVKVIDKSKLDEVSRSHLFQEVRCMKLVQHPNVVRLYEVIDTQTKLYLILELGDGGDLYDYIMRHETGLTEQVARDYFRQIVRAISYCHRLHVVHRDLKPENVVFFEKLGMVKLTDFGFSNKFDPGQKLETSCGSLAYSAPEILLGDSYDAPAVDVWSLGVILYMLVCGQAPFQEANDSETLTMIMDCKYTVPQHVSTPCKNLIRRMLIREPERRATLQQIANDPWLADGKDEANIEYLPLVSRHQVSDEDHNLIIQKMVNGNIATKEEILEALDKNEYNHITATYFLLAERKLRAQRQEQMQRKQRPEQLSIITTMCGNTLGTNITGVGNKIVGPGRPASGVGGGSGNNKLNNVNRLNVGTNNDLLQVGGNNNLPNPSLLSVPRTPGDLPQRARKCSIVQEEEDEEDLSGCSGREDTTGHHHYVCSLNRRGSRSEGKLNIAIQERIAAETAEQRRRQEALKSTTVISSSPPISSTSPRSIPREILRKKTPSPPSITRTTTTTTAQASPAAAAVNSVVQNQSTKWRMGGPKIFGNTKSMSVDITTTSSKISTTILNESSTISIPIQRQHLSTTTPSKYKTMPSPSNLSSTQNQLNEIFEEGTNGAVGDGNTPSSENKSPRTFSSRTQARTNNYEQRRSKFHKTRTASCSSSDASEDDDSESRKKRAHKINNATGTGKPLPGGRRDSHDDSSDSQDQGSAPTAASRTSQNEASSACNTNTTSTTTTNTTSSSNQTNDKSTTKNTKNQANNFSNRRQHRNGRRRTGETRLRESQSLNRITEVQEDVTTTTTASAAITATTVVHLVNNDLLLDTTDSTTEAHPEDMLESNGIISTNNKIVKSSFGARLLQGWSLGSNTKNKEKLNLSPIKKSPRVTTASNDDFKLKIVTEKSNIKKMRLLGRYFQVHKKLCIPGIFGGRGRIYKAQSCSSLARDRITTTSQTAGGCIVAPGGGHGQGSGGGDGKRPMSDLVGRTKVLLSGGNNSLSDDCSINGSCGSDINQNGALLVYDTDNNTKGGGGGGGDVNGDAHMPSSEHHLNDGAGRICQIHLGDTTKCCNLC